MSNEALPEWDLSDLFAGVDDPVLTQALDSLPGRAEAFANTYKGTLAVDELTAAHLINALKAYTELLNDLYKPLCYASLHFSTNTQDSARGALLQRSREVGSQVEVHLVFFDLELAQIPDDTYARASADSAVAPYLHYLEVQREAAKHHLSEVEERILAETSTVRGSALVRLFTEVQSRANYVYDGETLNQSRVLSKLYDDDREVRAKAAACITATMKDNAHVGTYIFNTLLHEKDILDRLRSFPTPESSRHLNNEIAESVIHTVADVIGEHYGTVADYYRLKQELLGLNELTHIDRYAPLPASEGDVSFAEAKTIVLDAFAEFSPKLADMTEPFFSRNWIDAKLGDGKQGGAYCAGVTPDLHPYVLMNFTGKQRDVMTLAHELGHGIHDVLAARNHLLDYHPVLPVAETASTFAEMLVFDKLLAEIDDPNQKLALLCGKIEDSFATVFRQIAMYRFEQKAHALRREGGEQTTEAYNGLWQSCQQDMFQDALTLGDDHAWWWLYIPHIIKTPFYVYAYSFGELLVFALYARYKEEGPSFVDGYFEMLARGGSQAPVDLVASVGFDIASADFWRGGCALIQERVDAARALAATI